MIIVMQAHANDAAIHNVVQLIRQRGLSEHISRGTERTIIGAVGDERVFEPTEFERLPQVERAIKIMHDWRIVSREAWAEDTQFTVRGHIIGGANPIFAQYAKSSLKNDNSAPIIVFDPFAQSANPYSLTPPINEKEAAKQLLQHSKTAHAAQQIVAVRLRDRSHIQAALDAQADVLYVSGNLLDNPNVLHELGNLNVPVITCKSPSHSVRDWLLTAEQIVLRGNQHVILGDAGTFNGHGTPLRLDIEAIAQAKKLSHLPIAVDISGLANRYLNHERLTKLALIAGAHLVIS